MYPVCQALLAIRKSSLAQAIAYFDEGIAGANNLLDIKFELDIFIAALKEQQAYEQVIHYQSVLIDMLNEHYDMKNGNN